METNLVKNFFETEIFSQPIITIKKFNKGQLPVFYVKLADNTQLTIKFYATIEKVLRAYNIAIGLEQNPEFKAPRLYKLPNKYLCYDNFFGLCFYYIEGSEISASKLNKHLFKEIAQAYAVFQKPLPYIDNLAEEITLDKYLEKAQKQLLDYKFNGKSRLQRIFFNIALYLGKQFVSQMAQETHINENCPLKLIHCDITKSNMLFKNGHFQSFLDMDSVCYSYVGRDIAEFIITSVQHYPFYKTKKKSIYLWYTEIANELKLPSNEYIYGLDIYYLCRVLRRLFFYQNKLTFCKLFNFIEFTRLRRVCKMAILAQNKKSLAYRPISYPLSASINDLTNAKSAELHVKTR